jgi:hypothetical protein
VVVTRRLSFLLRRCAVRVADHRTVPVEIVPVEIVPVEIVMVRGDAFR